MRSNGRRAWLPHLRFPSEGSGYVTPNYGGALRLVSLGSDVKRVYYSLPSFLGRARAGFRQKVVSYGTENGFNLYDGSYRAMLYFKPTGVWVRQWDAKLAECAAGAGEGAFSNTFELVHWLGNEATQWHQYRVETADGKGHLYVDGHYRGEWNLDHSSVARRVEHWVKGPAVAESLIDYTRVRPNPERQRSYFFGFEDQPVGEQPTYWRETNSNDTWNGNRWSVISEAGNHVYHRQWSKEMDNGGELSLLHLFARDVTFSGDFKINDSDDSSVLYFNVRRNHEESRIVVRYEPTTGKLELLEREAKNLSVKSLAKPETWYAGSGWNHFDITTDGSAVEVSLSNSDGERLLMQTKIASHQTYGRVGIQARRADVSFDNLSVTSLAEAKDGVREFLIDREGSTNSAAIVKLDADPEELLLFAAPNCYSWDHAAKTWALLDTKPCSANMLVVDGQSATTLIRARRENCKNNAEDRDECARHADAWKCKDKGPDDPDDYEADTCEYFNQARECPTDKPQCACVDALNVWEVCDMVYFRDYVELSTDGGTSFGPKKYIQGDGGEDFAHRQWRNRITMPNKMSQSSTGRVFFTSGETGDGNEAEGGVQIFYIDIDDLDDPSIPWTASRTKHDYPTFGINLQEGKVIETKPGELRAYFRTNLGYLYESLSTNDGVSWSTPRATPFRATMTSFNVERDPANGDLYMVWEYEDTAESPCASGSPRERVALAKSTDGAASWQFVADLDDWEGHRLRHMNHGLKVIDGSVWVHLSRRDENLSGWNGDFKARFWEIDTDRVGSSFAFPGTH